jgi:hypothetical protein
MKSRRLDITASVGQIHATKWRVVQSSIWSTGMSAVRTVTREVAGLFVDDVSFAFAIVAWLVLNWLLLPRLGLSGAWQGAILCAGFALILIESTIRRAARK